MTTTKLIYLAKRNPSIAPEDFPQRWKQHAVLAASFGHINEQFVGLAQCSLLREATGGAFLCADYDGVNLLTMSSRSAIEKVTNDPDTLATMVPDELRVFSDVVVNFSMTAEEEVLLAPQPIGKVRGKLCLIAFLRRRAGTPVEAFATHWRQVHAPLLRGASARVLRHVHNHVVGEPPAGFDYDGISELWFDRIEDVQSLFDAAHSARVAEDLALFCDPARSLTLLTHVTHAYFVHPI